jgi:hypothetical protein
MLECGTSFRHFRKRSTIFILASPEGGTISGSFASNCLRSSGEDLFRILCGSATAISLTSLVIMIVALLNSKDVIRVHCSVSKPSSLYSLHIQGLIPVSKHPIFDFNDTNIFTLTKDGERIYFSPSYCT